MIHGLIDQYHLPLRGKCHDNAVAESFFSLLKGERIRRKSYKTRNEARSDVFSYIGFFYKVACRHGDNNGESSIEFEKQYYEKLLSVQNAEFPIKRQKLVEAAHR